LIRFIVALLSRRDSYHPWAVRLAGQFPPPWKTCEAALSEAFDLLGDPGTAPLRGLLRRRAAVVTFDLAANLEAVLKFMEKYSDVPTSLADASLVRMTEMVEAPILLTTDSDFKTYRRHGRQVIPHVTPKREPHRK
jgi:hypothetical protein